MDDARVIDKLVCVDPAKIDVIWPRVKDFIASAFLHSNADDPMESIKEDLDKKLALLWVVWDGKGIIAVAVTKLLVLPNGRKICVIAACAGRELPRWLKFISELEAYAKVEQCVAFRMMGRPGWKKYFQPYGYSEPWVCLEKELT